jgi:hypothetical protein
MSLRKIISNIPGWRTKRKIVVIESDDWGSIRTRSKSDYHEMLKNGLDVDSSNFTFSDSLESNSDLANLFELLDRHRDSKGRSAVFTPMCIMANPDFEKIKESDFEHYFYESFTDTCKKYPDHDKVIDFWHEGEEKRLFMPAFHGREHLNVSRWMNGLKDGNIGLLNAFEHQSFGATHYNGYEIPEYLGAFHPDHSSDIPELSRVIETGAQLFRINCGRDPSHFIAPNKESARELDKTLWENGTRYLTLSKIRTYPLGDKRYKTEYNWLGKKNRLGQIIITRNCIFEPTSFEKKDWVDTCLQEIEIAFRWMKPAIINSHRVNYIGFINPENSSDGLKELDRLLSAIINRWPEVEFLTSSELGHEINSRIQAV